MEREEGIKPYARLFLPLILLAVTAMSDSGAGMVPSRRRLGPYLSYLNPAMTQEPPRTARIMTGSNIQLGRSAVIFR